MHSTGNRENTHENPSNINRYDKHIAVKKIVQKHAEKMLK